MLAKRIIPCLDVKDGRVVKGVRFLHLSDAGDPVEAAKAYEKQKADELVFLDITASFERRKTLVALVRRIARNIFMPFTVGGGIRNIDDIRALLNAGADKISINTAAVNKPKLIRDASRRFGSQCIVVAIDAKKIDRRQRTEDREQKTENRRQRKTKDLSSDFRSLTSESKWEVFTHGGRTATGLDAIEWAKSAERSGAGEILLTSMDFDGTKDGYDIELTRRVSGSLRIPVIASGGAGTKQHFLDVFEHGKADAALAATIFHYGEYKVQDVKKYLKANGVNVRIS